MSAAPSRMKMIKLTAALIEGFAATYISPQYDDAQPTPQFHRECWAMYCKPILQAAVAAPRGHAKTTALTTDMILAEVLFRNEEYVILVSSNEEMAIELLGDITRELTDNEDLIDAFEIKGFLTCAKTDIIVEFKDGHQFRILARGSGQKMRGRKWRGKRPGLIVCDDLEDDEQVENIDRRAKFRRWFYRALKPALRKGGRLRIHGTILHEDSLLARIMKDKTWETLFYRAHAGFDDFSDILWPEQFSEERLKAIRQSFIEQFDSSGYSQEYLNDPFDNSESYLRKDDFLEQSEDEKRLPKKFFVGVDFAISKKQKANRTAMVIGGQCASNLLHIEDVHVGRWDSLEIIEELFDIQERYDPDLFFVEDGMIWKSISPILNQEMLKRNCYLNIQAILPINDKKTGGRSFQKRMKAGACRFNKQGSWFPGYEAELLRFTGDSDAVLDDQFDGTGILSRGLESTKLMDEEDFMSEDELYARKRNAPEDSGRNKHTGY